MEKLANTIYNNLLDMDYIDYNETTEKDLNNLLQDLELLKNQGNGSLLNAIKMLVDEVEE